MDNKTSNRSDGYNVDSDLERISKMLENRVEQFSLLGVESMESMLRFANNELTTVNHGHTIAVQIYISKGKKRGLGVISEPSNTDTTSTYIDQLIKTMELSKDSEVSPLPAGPRKFRAVRDFDAGVIDADLFTIAKEGINSSLEAGAERAAGAITVEDNSFSILTSTGIRASDRRTSALLNMRAMKNMSSGAAVSVSTHYAGLNSAESGKAAAQNAVKSQNPKAVEPGQYDVLLAPNVSASLIQLVGSAASAFSIEAGLSFLAGKLGQQIAPGSFALTDYGQIGNGVGSRAFDDEGSPTLTTHIIENGQLTHYLHNCTTASKFNTTSTGNAGIIDPSPWNLVVEGKSEPLDNMLGSIKRGILLTNNWYTRFQNYMTGEFSTLARDAAFLIVDGELSKPVSGLRLSDSLPRFLGSIKSISTERAWIKWWGEVTIPIQAPYIFVSDSKITIPT